MDFPETEIITNENIINNYLNVSEAEGLYKRINML